ncbi:MAG: hypothetical protein U1E27_10850, partial [Kiritimatiellia bacterium]|nr:hypothetical protein [Kiritimatiellia bacterium]
MNLKSLCPALAFALSVVVCLGLSGCSKDPVPSRTETAPAPLSPPGLADVDKPSEDLFPILTARPQPPIAEAFVGREVPYSETREAPAPTAAESARGFILFSRPINRAVYSASVPAPHERVESLSAYATPGEFEPMPFS